MRSSLPNEWARRLCFDTATGEPRPGLAVVVAHPDDETVGAGAQLSSWRGARFVYTTDGSPRKLLDARAAGYNTREAYAAARRAEMLAALSLAGIGSHQIYEFCYVDQEAPHHLIALSEQFAELFRRWNLDVVITHPFEGGHPDHDATAFAVHMACRRLEVETGDAPEILEMASYHQRSGTLATFEFLPHGESSVIVKKLSESECAFKRRLFDCYRTQRQVLRQFPIAIEKFRPAPGYDFTQPPHEGRLFYEYFDWGMTAARWCTLAKAAIDRLAGSPGKKQFRMNHAWEP